PVRTQSRHRLYKRRDLHIILEIKRLLYEEQYTIAGAKKRLDEIIREEKRDDTDVAAIDVKTALLSTLEELRALRRLLE
ncbi:MAG TPA: MerR family transcriptional regulator, partial [Thermodesulfobacteriota bacterium]|nr:MerR family transcriptional regulator [Thermodesulfobacteriota bacterium]